MRLKPTDGKSVGLFISQQLEGSPGQSLLLRPGGVLFVGHSESPACVRHDLEYVRRAAYRKP